MNSQEEIFPLSFQQRQLHKIMALDNCPENYHMTDHAVLHGSINIDKLRQAILKVISDNDAFSIQLIKTDHHLIKASNNHTVMQRYDTKKNYNVQLLDWRTYSEKKKQNELKKFINDFNNKPFDLFSGPLFRIAIVQISRNETHLMFNIHHLISDDWSMSIINQNISKIINQKIDENSTMPNIEEKCNNFSYKEYVYWQKNWLLSKEKKQQFNYWKNKLENIPPLLPLPLDYSRPSNLEVESRIVKRLLPAKESQAIKKLASKKGVTLYVVLLSIFQILMWRLSNKKNIGIATILANREIVEIENTIGLFFNVIILTAKINPHSKFSSLLEEASKNLSEGIKYQTLPYQILIDELVKYKDPSYAPLAQVMFSFQNIDSGKFSLNEISFEKKGGMDKGSAYDLKITAYEKSDKIEFIWEYNNQLFKPETINTWVQYYFNMIADIVANETKAIGDISLINDLQKISVYENALQGNLKKNSIDSSSVVDIIQNIAENNPDHIASVDAQGSQNYEELFNNAKNLADLIDNLS